MSLRAVCFDVGGVVIRISTCWQDLLRRARLPVPPHITAASQLGDMPEFDDYQAGRLADDFYFGRLAVYLGGLTPGQARAIHESILVEPYPGVLALVEDLRGHGLLTGCLSNTNEPHWEAFFQSGRFPALPAMDVHLASFQIRESKPTAAAFRAFEAAVGAKPDTIILFDDSEANCEGARKIGWSAVRIDPAGDPAAQMRAALG